MQADRSVRKWWSLPNDAQLVLLVRRAQGGLPNEVTCIIMAQHSPNRLGWQPRISLQPRVSVRFPDSHFLKNIFCSKLLLLFWSFTTAAFLCKEWPLVHQCGWRAVPQWHVILLIQGLVFKVPSVLVELFAQASQGWAHTARVCQAGGWHEPNLRI